MNEASRIAEELAGPGSCMTAAAMLIAMCEDRLLRIPGPDLDHIGRLNDLGCAKAFLPTPLGRQVAMVLMARHGITPEPRQR